MKRIIILAAFAGVFKIAAAQEITDGDRSPINGMSMQQFEGFRDGRSMGMDRVAELNHYPGPANVLKYAAQLKLTAAQQKEVKAINDALQRKVLEMGRIIIEQEKQLDDLFHSGKINDGSLIWQTQQYGLYQGELRNAHLQAHLKTKKILTAAQISKYEQLCGY